MRKRFDKCSKLKSLTLTIIESIIRGSFVSVFSVKRELSKSLFDSTVEFLSLKENIPAISNAEAPLKAQFLFNK